jgi:hypothetical protein
MSFEIGPTPPARFTPPARRFAEPAPAAFYLPAPARVDTAELSLPAFPPPDVLDEVGRAADRAAELAAANRELHFTRDEDTGRVIVQVRDLDGNVIRTIPPSQALSVLSGAAV